MPARIGFKETSVYDSENLNTRKSILAIKPIIYSNMIVPNYIDWQKNLRKYKKAIHLYNGLPFKYLISGEFTLGILFPFYILIRFYYR